MGLDMYLYCNSRIVCREMNDENDFMESYYKEHGIAVSWRKANAVHKWFVDNIQGGNDDCGYYPVYVEDLVRLHDTCKTVIDSSNLVDGDICCGYTFEDGKEVPLMERGTIIENTEVAEELMPTQSGFFFGSTGYDQWYIWDLEYTVNKLGKLLDMLKPNGDYGGVVHTEEPDWYVKFQYHSSW